MNGVTHTITLRSTDKPSSINNRLDWYCQARLLNDDFSVPFHDHMSVKESIQFAQSYLKEAYDAELVCVGFSPAELSGFEEWTLDLRIHTTMGLASADIPYDVL